MATVDSAVGAFVEQVRSLAEKFSTAMVKVMPAEPSARAACEVDLDPDEFLEAVSLLNESDRDLPSQYQRVAERATT